MSASGTGRSTGGGAATGAGVLFQARVAAWLAVHILGENDAESPWGLSASLNLVSCETAAAVDDIFAAAADGGRIFLQAKRTLVLSTKPNSDLASALDQCVRQFLDSRSTGVPLHVLRDRLVVVTGTGSSEPVKRNLRAVLGRLHALPAASAISEAAKNDEEKKALGILVDHVKRSWKTATGSQPRDSEFRDLLALIWLEVLGIEKEESEERRAKDLLRVVLPNPNDADSAWDVLVSHCGTMISTRSSADRRVLESVLFGARIRHHAARSYRLDIDRLRQQSDRVLARLVGDAGISLGGARVKIARPYAERLRAAVEDGSLLIVGEPGSGKSGTLYEAAEALIAEGRDVVLLSTQDPPFASLGQLRTELQLDHDVTEVLANWSGAEPGILVIDALDAARNEPAARALRTLIRDVLERAGRWRVVASIREYDVRYGREIRQMFSGAPPAGPVPPLAGGDFARVRHLVVGPLSDAELADLAATAPTLHQLVSTAPPHLAALFRNVFNLRLAAELLDTGIDVAAIRAAHTQLELLDLYWAERVIHTGEVREADAREAVLRHAVEGMVRERSLRVDRDQVAGNPGASPALADVLHAHVLIEWAPGPGRTPDRSTLAFAHHILFDYAVERLLLRRNAQRFANTFAADPPLLLLIRPSVLLHFHHLWDEEPSPASHGAFWDAVFAVSGHAAIPEIGKLIGPSVAGASAGEISELAPLTEALNGSDPDRRRAAENAFDHLIRSMLADADLAFRPGAPWSALAEQVSHKIEITTAYSIAAFLGVATEREDLTEKQFTAVGAAARRLMEFAWSRSPRDRWLVIRAIGFVGSTFSSNPGESATLFRRALEPEHLAAHGSEEMQWIARQVKLLVRHDPVLVRDIYVAAFGFREQSSAPAPMGGIIMPMVSNRRQDYDGALFGLKQAFPAFLRVAPAEAIIAMNHALEVHIERETNRTENAEQSSFDLLGGPVHLLPDYSFIWDRDHAYPDEYAVQLLDDVEQYIDDLAKDEARLAELRPVVETTVRTCRLAGVWRRLLRLGSRHPLTLGVALKELAWTPAVLSELDTSTVAGEFIHALVPYLSVENREKVEQAILALSGAGASKTAELGDATRDRLLGCLGDTEPVTEDARIRLEDLRTRNAVPENRTPQDFFQITSTAYGESEILAERGVPVDEEPNRRMRELEAPVKEFAANFLNSAPTPVDLAAVLPRLRELQEAVDSANENGVHPDQASYAWGTLTKGCEAASRTIGLECSDETGAFIREILLTASQDAEPRADPEVDAAFDTFPSWGSSIPRIEAAQGLMALASRESCADAEVLTAIRALSVDPAPQVRFQIATRLGSALRYVPDLGWELMERMAREEESRGVLAGMLQYSLWSIRGLNPDRVIALVTNIYARMSDGPGVKEVRNACADILFGLYLWRNHDVSRRVVLEIADDVANHLQTAAHLVPQVREILTHGPTDPPDVEADAARRRALDFLLRATRSGITLIDSLTDSGNTATTPGQHGQLSDTDLQTLGHLVDAAGFNLYLSSGAYRGDDENGPTAGAQARLLEEAGPLLDELAEVGLPSLTHHLLETLEVLVPYDPAGVFRRVARVIRGGRKGHYQYDNMAQDVLVPLVERYLADYRSVFQEDEDLRAALVEVLDTFVAAGSPGARRLTYGLDAIFR